MSQTSKPWHRMYDPEVFDPDILLADSMAALLSSAFQEYGDNPAFSCILPNGTCATLSFRDVDRLSTACAFYLREELGLKPGDVVAVEAPNSLGYPVVAFGILRAGLTLTGINPLYTVEEARYQLLDSGAKVLFVIDIFGDRVAGAIEGSAVRHVIRMSVADFFPPAKRFLIEFALKHVQKRVPAMSIPSISLRDAVAIGAKHRQGRDVLDLAKGRGLDDIAIYQYTGGTTGRSKGAALTERNLLSNITQQDSFNGDILRAQGDQHETILLVLPLYHVYALAIGAMNGLRSGAHLVLVPSPRPLQNLKPAFETFDITMLPGISALFSGLLAQDWFVRNPPASLRWSLSGAAPLPQALRARWEAITGCQIYEGYGLTECTCVVTSPPLDHRNRPGTVGVPLPGTDIMIAGVDGTPLPILEPGEVLVRGPQVMREYLGRPDATSEALRDGWLHTGDIGFLDEDGYLTIVDRMKDMLIVSGFNVFPADLEDVLVGHDRVSEAAVVSVPDDHMGEVPWAFIVPKDDGLDEQTLRQYCETRLTNYKRPRRYLFVEDLPKSPVGKVLRRKLREQARAMACDPTV